MQAEVAPELRPSGRRARCAEQQRRVDRPRAAITIGVRLEVSRPPCGVRASTPMARAPRITSRSARAPVHASAPAARAGTRYASPACCLAPVGQPKAHTPAALASARVAPQVAARPAEPLGAAADQRGVAARQLGGDLGDAERLLDAVEHRCGVVGSELVEAVLRSASARARGRACGSRCRSSRASSRRSRGRAAARSAAARACDLPAVAVQPREHVPRPRRSRPPVGRSPPSSSTTTRAPPSASSLGHHGAAGAGADHAASARSGPRCGVRAARAGTASAPARRRAPPARARAIAARRARTSRTRAAAS